MGINAELVRLVADLRQRDFLRGSRVVEIGAQDVCVAPEVIAEILLKHRFAYEQKNLEGIRANGLYEILGMSHYSSIDASGASGSLMFDLNRDLRQDYQFVETYDLVTNLGTAEHCFNQHAAFKNMHDLCRPGGLMVHALTAQGNVNHGFYNYHPRFIADLAAANDYEIVKLAFTVDYRPALIEYSLEAFKQWDSHDVLLYAVLRKDADDEFRTPFDGMFLSTNKLHGYLSVNDDPLISEFAPYLKGGNWENTQGFDTPITSRGVFTRLFWKARSKLRNRA
tara:strand:- start:154521 stop:155363 length:843 start_codon:yes stop_codon:yes gene_type:complete